jgi:choline dehydrogenase-like flavoprotein/heme-degrading monooxygenase HmoA
VNLPGSSGWSRQTIAAENVGGGWKMSAELSETQLIVLRALCDTFVPAVKVADDPTGFWARTASDLGVDRVLARHLTEDVPEGLRGGLLGLLDGLAAQGFVSASQDRREKILTQLSGSSPDAARGINFYQKQTLLLAYGLPEEPVPDQNLVTYGSPRGQNPNWEVLGYPGPVSVPPDRPKQIQTVTPQRDSLTLEADVCIVGSGAGGAVIAARTAARGRRVVVLEAGGHYNSADFHQLELWGYKHLWYKGGATPTADGNVLLLAGGSLGGGTEINWMNCVRTPPLVREDWARQYGIEGADAAEFDRYIEAVEQRIMASPQTAYFNSQNLRMREGCARLGYLSKQTHINWDPNLFQPLMAGYTGFGDQTGGKQTARRTYLLDAYRSGAQIIVHCRAERILVRQGRAVGVEATYSDPQGRKAKVVVSAAQVVVACGSVESPALLLRSGIGGPAVGKYLRVQPGGAVYAVYKEKQKGWWGSPMTTNCEQFTDTGGGFGFYMEIPAFGPGFVASVIPWPSGRGHKELITKVPYISTFIWFLRDKGSGQVTIDKAGNAVPVYQLTDETDQKNFRHATAEAVRIHEAAGAQEILYGVGGKLLTWKRGQNLDSYIQTLMGQPLLDGAQAMISAHQLCTCRMGRDRSTSVADTDGELYDVKGVWVGDGSACPTALGANPMVTIMALAERTADRMAARADARAGRSTRQDFGATSYSGATSSDRDFPTLPEMATNALGGMADMMANPGRTFSEMVGIMTNPFNVLALGERLLLGRPANGPVTTPARDDATQYEHERSPMFSHIIELTAKPGRAKELVDTIRDQAIPQIIRSSEGFVDEIVLLSDTDANHVTAISFWRSKQDAERFSAGGFARVSVLLQSLLAAVPQRREFVVGASTNGQIQGWGA